MTDDPRQRAAATKRARTREALIDAGSRLFSDRDWSAVRMEDVAAEAGVSVATAYNHFASKEILLNACYEPIVNEVIAAGTAAASGSGDITEAVGTCMHSLISILRNRRNLTVTFMAIAVFGSLSGDKTPDDPILQTLTLLSEALGAVLDAGQARGQIDMNLDTGSLARDYTNLVLTRVLMQADESVDDTWQYVMDKLLAELHPAAEPWWRGALDELKKQQRP